MADVFVSYKAEDRRRVKPLVDALESDGFSVWWDAQIEGGEAWRHSIEAELDAAKCVVVAWSRRSAGPEGTFVQDEATRAQRRHVYVPVTIEKVHLPLGFGETQALDLQGWKGDRSDPRYRAVLAAVDKRVGIDAKRERSPTGRVVVNRRTAVIGGSAVGAAFLAGVGTWLFTRPSSAHGDSIAVLPFENLSGDPKQAYFSDGIAEELRSALSRLAGLKVVGRISSEAVRDTDAGTAARKLGVANILTGSVRQSPSTIRVSAQLVDGRNGMERWSQSYDRAPGDVIKIQTDIAENVARALAIALAGAARAAIVLGGTQNPAAQNLLLKAIATGRSGTRDGVRASESLINEALALDPNYAEAYVQKAIGLNWYAGSFANDAELPQYREAALKNVQYALRLAPNLSSAHNALAEIYRISLDLPAANTEFKRALSLAPGDAAALRNYAQFTSKLGHAAQSLRLVEQGFALDPLNPQSYRAYVEVLIGNRRYADAVGRSEELRQMSPESFHFHLEVAYCLILLGRFGEAVQILRGAEGSARFMGEALLFARQRKRAEAEAKIASIKQQYGDAASYQYGQIYAQLGETDQAFAALERAWQIRDSGLLWVKVDAMLDPLRHDVRFDDLVRRLGFPT
jgi:TolB-like protein/tetratricopeptide (TPR) repeat protein